MADPSGQCGRPSLRRRFACWFGSVFIIGAVVLRLAHYRAEVEVLSRDVDVQLWSRLAAVKAQERFAPDTLLDPHLRAAGVFLPELPAATHRAAPRILGWPVPALEPAIDAGAFVWFAGVWSRDGVGIDDLDLPGDLRWDRTWPERSDTLWTTDDGRYRLASTTGAHNTVLVVGTPLEGLAAASRRAAAYQILTFLVWVPIVLGVAWLALSRVLVPLSQIAATAQRIRAGRFAERIDVTRTDTEFAEMAGTINDMLDRLDEIRTSQARFNADVAHQLLNPVHAILLESESAVGESRPAQDLAAALGRVRGMACRIEGLCETLLAYARSAAIDPSRLEAVDLEPVVASAIDRVVALATPRGITIVPPASDVVVRGDAALLEEVFVNLLVNAIEHSPDGGRVEVVVHDGGRRIAVVDHGAGVSPADEPRLFGRFHSGKATGGHGIGLALSRRILRSHGGDLMHEPTPGAGATFVLRFPPRL
jgi:signal transduction histidine kinase